MRVSNLLSSITHSLSAGWKRLSTSWRNHKVSLLAHTPKQQTAATPCPFSLKTLQTWAIRPEPVDGSDLILLRGKRLNHQNLQSLKDSLTAHYQDFYENPVALDSKINFILVELGLAKIAGTELKSTGWFQARLSSGILSELDYHLICNDPIDFGLQWLDCGHSLSPSFTNLCLLPALDKDSRPRFNHESLVRAGFLRTAENNELYHAPGPFQRKYLMQLKYCSHLPVFISPETVTRIHQHYPELSTATVIEDTAETTQLLNHHQQLYQQAINELNQLAARPTPYLLGKTISKLAEAATAKETSLTLHALAKDLTYQQLTPEHFENYLLTLMVAMPDNLNDLALLSECCQKCLSTEHSSSALSSWAEEFHEAVIDIKQQMTRLNGIPKYEVHHRYPNKLPDYLSKFHTATDEETRDRYLTQMHHLTVTVTENANRSDKQRAIRNHIMQCSRSWLQAQEAKFARKLPEALQFKLQNSPISVESLGIKKEMSTDWQETLREINTPEKSRPQFEKDRVRTDFVLRNQESHTGLTTKKFDHSRRPMQISHLARYLNNRTAAMTLSQLTSQTMASYQIKLEQKRLGNVTPFLLQPMGRDPKDNNYIQITKRRDGNLLVEYILDASKPVYQVRSDRAGVLGLKKYQIKSATVVSMAALNKGYIDASEPKVEVIADIDEGGIEWLTQDLEKTSCPFDDQDLI